MTILLERHKQSKKVILERLREIADVAEEVGMKSLAGDIRTTRIPKVETESFHLVVLGEFNHGKSTFVNALLGAEVLPMGITPTTAALNHVVHAESPYARATLLDGDTIDLTPEGLADWVTVAGTRSGDVAFVEVGHPAELLQENITLVDTPGVNDMNEQRADITYGYVPRADAVIFLLDAGQALKDSEREFLSSHVLAGSKDRLIFVLGKIDLLSKEEQGAVYDYVKAGLAKLVDQPVVFPISARAHLTGDTDAGQMEPLLKYLGRFLDTDRAQILLDNAATDAARTAAYLQQNLGVKLYSYDLDVAELETRIDQVRRQLDASKRSLDELHTRIDAEANAIKAQVQLDLEGFTRRFIDEIPPQLDRADADDIKRYLPSFIEDKFREWAELEGHRLASLLERLAEDVITITNENVEAASAALAERLGPADTQVEIDVDSFKYDVGVYAVGAIGTTVFLFVNTLAGGLLTLAAPILAIVIKSKVAGDIRQQAKDKVGEAILRASEVMGPHFDKCIDDFAKRLGDFVTTAGVALYKGISEILDQAMLERKAREGELDEQRSETNALAERVAAARHALQGVRRDVWHTEETVH